MHHLFQAAKYSILAAEVAVHAFGPSADRLPGSYSAAMRHKVTAGGIRSWTPSHVLCNGSDMLLVQDRIIQELLDNQIVLVSDFDDNWNEQVCFFYIARALPLSVEAASPTSLPSYNGGFTGTYV